MHAVKACSEELVSNWKLYSCKCIKTLTATAISASITILIFLELQIRDCIINVLNLVNVHTLQTTAKAYYLSGVSKL